MAWHVHFGGDKLSAISDETYDEIRGQILAASQNGDSALIGLQTSASHFELIWTPGAPIYFSYFDENADTAD